VIFQDLDSDVNDDKVHCDGKSHMMLMMSLLAER